MATIFSVPDNLHRTVQLNVPQQRIDIGIPAFRSTEELRLRHVLQMPFGAQCPTWHVGGDGPIPARHEPLAQSPVRLAR